MYMNLFPEGEGLIQSLGSFLVSLSRITALTNEIIEAARLTDCITKSSIGFLIFTLYAMT